MIIYKLLGNYKERMKIMDVLTIVAILVNGLIIVGFHEKTERNNINEIIKEICLFGGVDISATITLIFFLLPHEHNVRISQEWLYFCILCDVLVILDIVDLLKYIIKNKK